VSEAEYAARLKEGPTREELAARLAEAQLDFYQCEACLGAVSSVMLATLVSINAPHAALRPKAMAAGLRSIDDAAIALRRVVGQHHIACASVVTEADMALLRYDAAARARAIVAVEGEQAEGEGVLSTDGPPPVTLPPGAYIDAGDSEGGAP